MRTTPKILRKAARTIHLLGIPSLALLALACTSSQESLSKPAPATSDLIRTLQKEVTAIRGLAFTGDVTVGEYTRDELNTFWTKDMERSMTRDEVKRIHKSLVQFGLILEHVDLYQVWINRNVSSTNALYNWETKEVRLMRQSEGEPAKDVWSRDRMLVHELCHAAQDQHYNLCTLPVELKDNNDLVLAVKALCEGDATIVSLKWGFKEDFDGFWKLFDRNFMEGIKVNESQGFPAYLENAKFFPYGPGSDFVRKVLKRANWDWGAISKAYSDLPGSTEQILHPEKYFESGRDYPQNVIVEGLAAILGDGWNEVYHNVHGEFGVRLLLEEFRIGSPRSRRQAAEGWDGDRYYVLEHAHGALASVWLTVWDSKEDAREFVDAYALALEAKFKGAERAVANQRLTLSKGNRHAILERQGAEVLVLDGVGAGAGGQIGKIWLASKKTEIRKVERIPAANSK